MRKKFQQLSVSQKTFFGKLETVMQPGMNVKKIINEGWYWFTSRQIFSLNLGHSHKMKLENK